MIHIENEKLIIVGGQNTYKNLAFMILNKIRYGQPLVMSVKIDNLDVAEELIDLFEPVGVKVTARKNSTMMLNNAQTPIQIINLEAR